MTWTVREVDPTACPHCSPEQPGSEHWRCVNEPKKPHPGRAPALHCADCGHHIGKTRGHFVVDGEVFCGRCIEARNPRRYPPPYSRAAAALELGVWP